MSYITPDLVVSPKSMVSDLEVIHDGGEGDWSLAKMKWDGEEAMGLRWNGGSGKPGSVDIGNPQSRGIPTWFILPDEIANVVVKMLELNNKISKK